MRALKFLGVFLGTLIVVLIIIFGFRLDALTSLFENREAIQEGGEWVAKTGSLKGLTEYIDAQPQRVSLVSYAADSPDSSLLYNARTPRTMGRLSNLFLVIEYVRQVQSGKLNPDERILLGQVAQYQLPNVDQSHHEAMAEWLEEQDKIDENNAVPLQVLVQASLKFNDIALADFLLFKLGIDNIRELMDALNVQQTELPLPFCGLYIAINPPENKPATAHFDSLSYISRPQFQEMVLKKARRFVEDKAFREGIIAQFKQENGLRLKFMQQRDALAFFPKTTAAEMAGLMKKLMQETLISATASKKIKDFLKWPLNEDKRLLEYLKTYGAVYDSRMGMAAGIDFGTSAFTGKSFAQAVFFDNLQVGFWLHMSSNLMLQDFQQRLIWDPALQQAARKAVTDPQKPEQNDS